MSGFKSPPWFVDTTNINIRIWEAVVGETLPCNREVGNIHDLRMCGER